MTRGKTLYGNDNSNRAFRVHLMNIGCCCCCWRGQGVQISSTCIVFFFNSKNQVYKRKSPFLQFESNGLLGIEKNLKRYHLSFETYSCLKKSAASITCCLPTTLSHCSLYCDILAFFTVCGGYLFSRGYGKCVLLERMSHSMKALHACIMI